MNSLWCLVSICAQVFGSLLHPCKRSLMGTVFRWWLASCVWRGVSFVWTRTFWKRSSYWSEYGNTTVLWLCITMTKNSGPESHVIVKYKFRWSTTETS